MANNFIYTDNIPDGPNNPSNDQPKMKVNTNSIDELIAVDHRSFNEDGGGIHEQVTLPVATQSPGVGDGAGALFALNSVTDSRAYPIWQNTFGGGTPGDAATFMFGPGTVVDPQGTVSVTGQVLIKWGFKEDTILGIGQIGSFNFAQPFPNECFTVILQVFLATATQTIPAIVTARSATGFSYILSVNPALLTQLHFIAIGR